MRKILPLICLIVPWEFYFYTSDYSTGWGIKFSVLYTNFDAQYGMLFVDLMEQTTLLSYGGFLPSIRTITWLMAALLCIVVMFYELFRENIEIHLNIRTIGILLLACAVLTMVSSVAVWNSSFRTIPVAPVFFTFSGYLLLHADRHGYSEDMNERKTQSY
ncbi:MAG: hypothetical protein SCH66_04025 [Methanolobus sp.]|nr:hypothetical protein [Methanolobus sp.]